MLSKIRRSEQKSLKGREPKTRIGKSQGLLEGGATILEEAEKKKTGGDRGQNGYGKRFQHTENAKLRGRR